MAEAVTVVGMVVAFTAVVISVGMVAVTSAIMAVTSATDMDTAVDTADLFGVLPACVADTDTDRRRS